ncbi:hypothetical protein M0804_015598 [Polistes exclamans]|nr:hypothetical protein M0804_015598 [Polistes exclamans]
MLDHSGHHYFALYHRHKFQGAFIQSFTVTNPRAADRGGTECGFCSSESVEKEGAEDGDLEECGDWGENCGWRRMDFDFQNS